MKAIKKLPMKKVYITDYISQYLYLLFDLHTNDMRVNRGFDSIGRVKLFSGIFTRQKLFRPLHLNGLLF